MPVVGAFLLPGNPLPLLREDNPPWRVLSDAARAAGAVLADLKPDVLLVYSTQWIAVLDQLWQMRPHSTGLHVDENWYAYGDMHMDLRADVAVGQACIDAANAAGIKSRAVDYEDFPIDSGTIAANGFVNPGGAIPLVVAANNVYHDFARTEQIGAIAAGCADALGRRAVVLGVGGLSSNYFDHDIDIATDHIVTPGEDAANRTFLAALESGSDAARAAIEPYAAAARPDMGLKHLAWILGATGGFKGARVHGYGATYGAGAAVVEFVLA